MKKYLSACCICIYLFTAQLTVHAFTMHGWWEHTKHTQHMQTHEHTTTPPQERSDHNMSVCLKQSIAILDTYTPLIIDTLFSYGLVKTYTDFSLLPNKDEYIVSFHDPWWGDDGDFPRFVDELYGHGIIMHC
jgi:hypothetical protein